MQIILQRAGPWSREGGMQLLFSLFKKGGGHSPPLLQLRHCLSLLIQVAIRTLHLSLRAKFNKVSNFLEEHASRSCQKATNSMSWALCPACHLFGMQAPSLFLNQCFLTPLNISKANLLECMNAYSVCGCSIINEWHHKYHTFMQCRPLVQGNQAQCYSSEAPSLLQQGARNTSQHAQVIFAKYKLH